MSDKQLAFLIDNMAKVLAARLEALQAAHGGLMQWVPAGPLDQFGATMRGEETPGVVQVQSPELAALWELVSNWQDDAGSLRGAE